MQLTNYTPFVVDVRSIKDMEGYRLATLMLKATYTIPTEGQMPVVAREQVPWCYADVPLDETGAGAPTHEADMPYEKPLPEFMVVGHAYAPKNKPMERIPFGVAVGQTIKRMHAVGERTWQQGLILASASPIAPITSLPASYAYGFGGVDPSSEEPDWCETNFAGMGYCNWPSSGRANGIRFPQLEPITKQFSTPTNKFLSLGLGPVVRAWKPRAQWAGTYDQLWQDNRWPALPTDFDPKFFQGAAQDQWLNADLSRQSVVFINMTHADSVYGSEVRFNIPALNFEATVHPRKGTSKLIELRPDTLILDPDNGRFSIVARKQVELNEGLHELEEVEFGTRQPQSGPRTIIIPLDSFVHQVRLPKLGR